MNLRHAVVIAGFLICTGSIIAGESAKPTLMQSRAIAAIKKWAANFTAIRCGLYRFRGDRLLIPGSFT